MSLHIHPTAARPVAQIVPLHNRTVGLGYIAGRLGRDDAAPATVVRLIRALTDQRGFPPPTAPRLVAGQLLDGAAAVTPRSKWPLDAVMAWFDNGIPPRIAAALDAEDQRAVDARINERLQSMGAVA